MALGVGIVNVPPDPIGQEGLRGNVQYLAEQDRFRKARFTQPSLDVMADVVGGGLGTENAEESKTDRFLF